MNELTTDKLIQQLGQAVQIAIEDRKPTAMIQATLAQAKLLGLDDGQTENDKPQPVEVIIQTVDARIRD